MLFGAHLCAQDAVDAARKANSPKTWKEVCYACVEESEFRLAQLCGLNIIVNADDLDEVSEFYQARGHFEELISLMESGIGLERAHMGIFTELGTLFAKYKPEKLMEHLKLFSTRLNIPRLIRVCDEQQHWKELTHLYVQYDEHDNAAMVMMKPFRRRLGARVLQGRLGEGEQCRGVLPRDQLLPR